MDFEKIDEACREIEEACHDSKACQALCKLIVLKAKVDRETAAVLEQVIKLIKENEMETREEIKYIVDIVEAVRRT